MVYNQGSDEGNGERAGYANRGGDNGAKATLAYLAAGFGL
jgi:hypothetical protein